MKRRFIPVICDKISRDRPLASITIRAAAGNPRRGWLTAGGRTVPVALGRGGIRANKREGDGGTPKGTFHPRQLWWRADRHPQPRTLLPVRAIAPEDAWCEDPSDRHYNKPVRLAHERGGDRLRREDHLYDFIKRCRESYGLTISGLMCIPPVDDAPAPHFALTAKIAARNGLKKLSMGMSADFAIAIQLGATHVRIGSAIFGHRPVTPP